MAVSSIHPTEPLPNFFAKNDLDLPSENERQILGLALRQAGIAQPAIARQSNKSQQTVSRFVKGLVTKGALKEVPRKSHGRRGQPGMAVQVNPKFAYTFGVSMMTDAISVVLMNFAGDVLQQRHYELQAMTRRAVISQLSDSISEILKVSRVSRSKVLGIGVSISGYCLDGKSRYNTPRLLDDWALIDIDDVLSAELNFPVWVENDGNAAAIGESLYGLGRTYSNFVYVYIAAGIGGGVIQGRELIRGSNGNGGELGLILPSHIHPHPTLDLLKQMITQEGVTIEGISQMVANFNPEWPGVDAWVARTSESFSLISSAIAALLDVQAIVLGGRMPAELSKKIIPHIEIFDDARRAEPRPRPRLLVSEVEGDASAIGAAAMPFKKYFFGNSPS